MVRRQPGASAVLITLEALPANLMMEKLISPADCFGGGRGSQRSFRLREALSQILYTGPLPSHHTELSL